METYQKQGPVGQILGGVAAQMEPELIGLASRLRNLRDKLDREAGRAGGICDHVFGATPCAPGDEARCDKRTGALGGVKDEIDECFVVAQRISDHLDMLARI